MPSQVLATSKKTEVVLAPDLVVDSCQTGSFVCDYGPTKVPPNKVKFTPTTFSDGGCFGYRIKLRTTRKQVKIAEEFELFHEKSTGRLETPVNGIIYRDWDEVGIRKGPHTVKVWVDGVELPALHYTRK